MLERIQKHIQERDSIVNDLNDIMGHCDDSPIEIEIDSQWSQDGDSLWISADGKPIDEDYYAYTVSSFSARGEELFMGEKDGLTYVMAYSEEGRWQDTYIFILSNKNKVERD